ncbi:MAG: PstS family phosphate ABC transporter substrate-binding protein [Gemmatimonadetes bacterium]|nr:PstS family phosphate ABC transporter substrate-binding protein [Gemmatimonadota bacterium]
MNIRLPALGFAAALLLVGCGKAEDAPEGSVSDLAGSVAVDGSSTVAPISEAVAEEFQGVNPGVRVTVGIAGTGGGFKRFCAGETDVSDASRPITEEEKAACQTAGIEWVELPVAWDGLSVVVNPKNDYATCLTVEELKKIWQPNSTVTTWRDVRSEFPAQQIKLYGPGTDSGTFDYFTEVVVGKAKSSRPDYQASEDDNVLVQGVAGDEYALGYFGHAYVKENPDKVKSIGIDNGAGCVEPTDQTISDKTYAPLSRQLFLYVKRAALARPEVSAFVGYYMDNAPEATSSTGYLPLDAAQYQQNKQVLAGGAGPAPTADSAAQLGAK